MQFAMVWITKWGQLLAGFERAYNLFLNSILHTIYDEKQSFRSILRVISAQVYFTGVQALPFILYISSIAAFALMFQAQYQMSFLGKSDLPAFLLVNVLFRELSVLIPAIILVARSGSAIASELSSMVVQREVASLKVMGIHPYSYIVFPRIMGGLISLVGLAIYFNLIALFVSILSVNIFLGMDFIHFMQSIFDHLTSVDILVFLLKTIVSSIIIFSVCCEKGLSKKTSSHEIPQATMSAVVTSMLYVLIFHFVFSASFYLFYYTKGFL